MTYSVFCKIMDSYSVFLICKKRRVVIKLILNCLIHFGMFFPYFYVAFIMLRPL